MNTATAAGPLFAGPAGANGTDWSAILPILVAAPAMVILVVTFVRGRMPTALTGAGILLPIAAYGLGSLQVMEGSKRVSFCGSCHVMTPIMRSVESNDGSLASTHYTRGLVPHEQACYTCHSGYGIWGTADAKIAGLRHMLNTVTGDYDLPIKKEGSFDIDSCLGCHAHVPAFRAVPVHRNQELQEQLVSHELACTGLCHPAAHPASALTGGGPPS